MFNGLEDHNRHAHPRFFFYYYYYFFNVHTMEEEGRFELGREIRTSDFRFMRCNLQPIKLPFKNPPCAFKSTLLETS
jgi:hypothetical protein